MLTARSCCPAPGDHCLSAACPPLSSSRSFWPRAGEGLPHRPCPGSGRCAGRCCPRPSVAQRHSGNTWPQEPACPRPTVNSVTAQRRELSSASPLVRPHRCHGHCPPRSQSWATCTGDPSRCLTRCLSVLDAPPVPLQCGRPCLLQAEVLAEDALLQATLRLHLAGRGRGGQRSAGSLRGSRSHRLEPRPLARCCGF